MILVQAWKVLTVFLCIWFIKELPAVMHQEVRPKRAYLYYASIYLTYLSCGVAILAHFNDGVVWYRTPLIFVAALLGVIWVVLSQRTNVSGVKDKPKSGR